MNGHNRSPKDVLRTFDSSMIPVSRQRSSFDLNDSILHPL